MNADYKYWTAVIAPFLLAGIVVGLLPHIDLATAGRFYTPGEGFVRQPALEAIHRFGPNLIVIFCLAVAVSLAWQKIWTVKEALFLVLCFLVGPGLLVNAVLKEHYGRARPVQVEQFGGKARFTSALTPTDQCAHNCSFTSGDPSVGFALVCFAFLVPRRKVPFTILAIAAGLAFGLLRIAQGGHFLSDVLFTAVASMTPPVLMFPYLRRRPARDLP